jgi:hypothetical protein
MSTLEFARSVHDNTSTHGPDKQCPPGAGNSHIQKHGIESWLISTLNSIHYKHIHIWAVLHDTRIVHIQEHIYVMLYIIYSMFSCSSYLFVCFTLKFVYVYVCLLLYCIYVYLYRIIYICIYIVYMFIYIVSYRIYIRDVYCTFRLMSVLYGCSFFSLLLLFCVSSHT